MEQLSESTFFEPEQNKSKRNLSSVHAKDLASIKKFLLEVIKNGKNSTYEGIRNVRKKFTSLPRDTFTAADRHNAEQIKKLLLKLHKTRPELSSKENYIQSKSFRNSSLSQETTFDRPNNLINESNASESVFASLRRPVQEFKIPNARKKTAIKKKKATGEKKIADQNAHETPVAPLNNETLATADDKEKKIQQYVKWANELREELRKRQEMS